MTKSSSPALFTITSLVKSLVKTNVVASTMKTILVTITVFPRLLDLGDMDNSFWIERENFREVEKSGDGRIV